MRAEPVGDAGQRVRLVHHDRHLVSLGRQVRGRRHVPAEAHEHVRADPVQDGAHAVHRAGQPAGHGQQLRRHRPGQRHRRDQLKVIAAHRDEPGLQAARRAEARHLDAAVRLPQRVGKRESRLNITG